MRIISVLWLSLIHICQDGKPSIPGHTQDGNITFPDGTTENNGSTGGKESPQTGDSQNILLVALLLAASGAALVALTVSQRRKAGQNR